jgi:hypothetical protein
MAAFGDLAGVATPLSNCLGNCSRAPADPLSVLGRGTEQVISLDSGASGGLLGVGEGMRKIPHWSWTVLLLALWAAAAGRARAGQLIERVQTDAGVTVAVPAGFRRADGRAAWPDPTTAEGAPVAPGAQGLATFTDGDARPLSIQIRKGAPHGFASLPAPSGGAAAEWTRGFAAELNVPQAYDFTPGQYAPERGAISLQYKVRGPSAARLMQLLPNSAPLWGSMIQSGGDVELSKCLLGALLAGQPSASDAELRSNTARAAARCKVDRAGVTRYIAQLGLREFLPSVSTISCVSFLTRLGTIVTLITAPIDRQAAVDAAAAVVWERTEIAANARLPIDATPSPVVPTPAKPTKAFERRHLAGIVIGSFLGVLLLGGTFSWLLVKVGVRPVLAVSSCHGVLVALSVLGLAKSGLRLDAELQAGTYLLASALVFRPLTRWLSTRVRGAGAAASDKAL